MLREISKSQRNKYYTITLMRHLRIVKIIETENRMEAARVGEGGRENGYTDSVLQGEEL